ncbi:hypothetical protein COY28_05230 [Candidatus Woesearchaeota archaeon CG_4_10_14_0_2_um_filter_57_5]|nr:MAG: hypothetical protein AUJ68_00340 [Candidatus Woesearchaeota archaeon CG1_02_57_44]PIN70841.1 MAG: hypothetical protein COV94_01015 [Candidatus Woesearchaeota archaeon CG11_big_fil_rev_8_21_14_0_20_57_5]PIZ51051.1 MAG: hypothetical protein COY28_05230 [Candidatus Woesearchaeota archaeon CG_4_10_14_0_2_um_filter_57_5]
MIFSQVRLQNIRSYVDETITLPAGSVLLSGDIGAGKSTILKAIEFVIFGLKGTDLTGSTLLRHGAGKGMVEVTLVLDSGEVIIRRGLKRTKTSIVQDIGSLQANGVLEELTPEELRAKVLLLLGYPASARNANLLYRYTVYTPQEDMKRIILEPAEQRLEIIRNLFLVDRYKQAKLNAELVAKEYRAQARALEREAAGKSLVEQRGKHVAAALASAQAELSDTQAALTKTKGQLEQASASVAASRRDQDAFTEAQARLGSLLATLDSLKGQATGLLKDKAALEQERLAVMRQLDKLPGDSSQISAARAALLAAERSQASQQALKQTHAVLVREQAQYVKAAAEQQAARKRLATLPDATTLSQRIESLEQELSQCMARRATVQAGISEQGRILSELEEGDVCPLCNQDLTDAYRESLLGSAKQHVAEHNATLTGLESDHVRVSGALAGARKEAKDYDALRESLLSRLNLLDGRKDTTDDIERVDAQLAAIMIADLPGLRATLACLEQKQQLLDKAKGLEERSQSIASSIGEVKARMASAQQQVSAAQQAVDSLAHAKAAFDSALAMQQQANDALLQAKSRESQATAALAGLQREAAHLAEQLALLAEKQRSAQNYTTLATWLTGFFSPLAETIERHVLHAIRAEFGQVFSSWFSAILDDEGIDARLDESFSPLLVQNEYETTPQHLSGGELTGLALSYRLALNKVLNNLTQGIATRDVLILDEPTDGFSSEQLDRVRDVFPQTGAKQTIIVSHEPKIEAFVDHCLRIHKENATSQVIA